MSANRGYYRRAIAADLIGVNHGEVVFKSSKSILFKSLKVRRIYDAKAHTLLYLSYSTKESTGSHHHALSTVPLYNTQAWQWALGQERE